MANSPLQNKLGLDLAQSQTANQDAAAYNASHATDPGRVQIEGGSTVGSSGSMGTQALSTPSTSQATPTAPTASQVMYSAPSTTQTTPSVIAPGTNAGTSTPGSAPVGMKTEKVNSFTTPAGTEGANIGVSTTPMPTIPAGQPKTLLQIRNEVKTQNPTLSSFDVMAEARKQYGAQQNVFNPVTTPVEAKTGITPLDTELQKIREQKTQAIKDAYKTYSLAQADYQKNAGYYTNFDGTNKQFNNILTDVQNTLANSKTGSLSDQEMAIIAAKNGVTVDEVKNPLNVYNKLQMTDEGKQVLGVTGRENQIKDLVTENDRAKQDAATALEQSTVTLNNQIEDAQKQLQRNLDFGTAAGAWSGAARSSGYEQGMKNMRDDTATVINRINSQIGNLNTNNAEYLNRLHTDFTTNMTRSKDSLDLDLKNLKFDSGLKLNGLQEKYGAGSKDLLKALDAIQEEFGTKSLDSFNKYLTSVKSIQGITMDNINLMDKMNTVTDALKNKRYNELTANNGALLQNISLSDIAKEVQAGKMDYQKYADTRNLMISTVTNALTKGGVTVSQEALNTITHLIDNGSTPSQVISQIGGGNLQTPTIDATTIADYSQQKRGRPNLQCGELANDYWEKMTGSAISHDPSINTYQGKVDAIKKIGQSSIPQVGGVFVLNTGSGPGHIGIVQSVNPDGSITALEANRNNSSTGGAPMLGTYTAEQLKNMTFSTAPAGTTPSSGGTATVTAGSTQNRPDRNNNPFDIKIKKANDWMNIPGATGVDDENHIIFSNPTDGYNWGLRDITAKMTGNSAQVSAITGQPLGPNSTLADLGSVYATDPKWAESVAKIAGTTVGTKLSDLSPSVIAPAIMRQEGFTGKVTSGAQPTTGTQTFTPFQTAGMDKFTKSGDPKDLKDVGVNQATYNSYITQKNTVPTGKPGEGVVGSLGIPISYERSIKSLVPATLMNSEIELEGLNNTIKSMYNAGMSQEDAVLSYFGVNVKPENKQKAISIMDKAKAFGSNLPENYFSQISNYINKGDDKGAVDLTENLGMQAAHKNNPGQENVSEAATLFATKNANNILKLMDQYENKFGTITGKWEDYTKGFFGDKEAQKLATSITQAISSMRKDLVGANITQGEKSALENLIPRLDESVETAKEKVLNLKSSPLAQLNALRSTVGLPEINENQLLDKNERVKLYQGAQSGATTTPTAPVTPPTVDPNRVNDLTSQFMNK